ncbi:hypothetical protein BCR32DRAFT_251219 [Anaeromyces robustus]|uniref:SAM domain-containing protein n=1 Tax=Anaeromyces robustus TaxID=1754192 RepID=A0A1Y1VTA2_9FUNG|nr:hypothetical protein BCR32DRAFT_251219 [Anaeromyces robustus]|eukprot:ORX64246.1 hypothetical protein BCR32DRAFT_251219 [Anaeromyces robustus]
MTYHQPYLENPLKMNSINLPTSEMIRNVTNNTRPTSDPSFNNLLKPMVLQQNNPYVKSMIYENRENTYSEIINTKSMTAKNLYNNGQYKSSEAEAIDKMFEDLSNYEKTLEEMANAKLDNNFIEELSAIEQWFTVLSECERTTVLYSLIQNISELQVRFFLTLLQQKVKNNPLFNSMIKKPISDSIYSSSTKHCSNTSSENSSLVNSTSADTFYDDDDYQKNSFVDNNNIQQNKSNQNQFSCPLNMNEYNLAMNSLSNQNLLNERTSSLSRPVKHHSQQHQHQHQHQHQTSQSSTSSQSPATSRKNSYMNTMMNDYSSNAAAATASNLSVLGNMNNMNTVLMNGMNNNQTTNQFLTPSQTNIMVNNNTSLYSSDNQRMNSFSNNSTNNLQMLNQNTINSLMNPNSLSILNSNNTSTAASSTSALPVLSPSTTPLTLLGTNNDIYKSNSNQTSPMISPIRPPKSSNKTVNNNNTNINVNDNSNQHQYQKQHQHQHQHQHNVKTTNEITTINNNNNNNNNKEILSKVENDKSKGKSLTEILLNNKEDSSSSSSKNASILSNILTLSKEMNDMVIKNRERAKKEKLAKSAVSTPSSPITPTTTTPSKKALSDDGETPHSGESVVNASPRCEKGKIPDQINLEMLEDIPSFLRSLRLHKYSPVFEGLNWKQMIKLDNDELLKRGVTALGARNKMLKVFDLIKAEAIKQGYLLILMIYLSCNNNY